MLGYALLSYVSLEIDMFAISWFWFKKFWSVWAPWVMLL